MPLLAAVPRWHLQPPGLCLQCRSLEPGLSQLLLLCAWRPAPSPRSLSEGLPKPGWREQAAAQNFQVAEHKLPACQPPRLRPLLELGAASPALP